MRTWTVRVLTMALLAVLLPVGLSAAGPAAAAGVRWYDGAIAYSPLRTNCITWDLAPGIGTFTGFLGDLDSATPSPQAGSVFYVHVVVAAIANPCAGQVAQVDLKLPGSMTPAVSAANPVRCFIDGASVPANCNQSVVPSGANPGAWNLGSTNADRFWAMPFGRTLEIQVPVTSPTSLVAQELRALVVSTDGGPTSTTPATASVSVFGGTPASTTVYYPTPSTTVAGFGQYTSRGYLATPGPGQVVFEIGTTTSYGLMTDSAAVPSSGNWTVSTDWRPAPGSPPPLAANTTYHWRMTFHPSGGGQPVLGADQTFRTPAAGMSVVGDGTPASCTGAAFDAAWPANGVTRRIEFDCGVAPVTITLTKAYDAVDFRNVTIDGGDRVTLKAAPNARHFRVGNADLTLTDIRLTQGTAVGNGISGQCGGSIWVSSYGRLTLNSVRIDDSTAALGGGLCVHPLGSVDASDTVITGNTAGIAGGGVYNAGTFGLWRGEISSNNGGDTGGGVFTGLPPGAPTTVAITSLAFATVAQNTATLGGGGLYNDIAGSTDVSTSTVSGNSAGTAAGLWNAGQAWVTGATIANNSATNGSTAGGMSSTTTLTVTDTLLAGNHPDNCSGANPTRVFLSRGGNLDSGTTCSLTNTAAGDVSAVNPNLGPLQNNGGLSRTHALPPGSPAVDAISGDAAAYCGMSDQRGVSTASPGNANTRVIDGNGDGIARCDVGAYELDPDGTAPRVQGIRATTATAQEGQTASWSVTFSEPVTGVDAGDFALTASGPAGAAVTAVTTTSAPASSYLVTASTGTGAGTLALNLVDDDSIRDDVGNRLGGLGTGNGSAAGDAVTVQSAPSLPPATDPGPGGTAPGPGPDPVPGGGGVTGGVTPPTTTDPAAQGTTTAAAVPGRVAALSASARNGKVRLRWGPAPGGVTGLAIQVSTDGKRWRTAGRPGPTATSFVWRKARPGVRYVFRIAALSPAGRGPWSVPVRVRVR